MHMELVYNEIEQSFDSNAALLEQSIHFMKSLEKIYKFNFETFMDV